MDEIKWSWGPNAYIIDLNTLHCFKATEMITYDLIKKGFSTKEEVMSQVTENLRLHWMLICDLHDEGESFQLLQDIIGCGLL